MKNLFYFIDFIYLFYCKTSYIVQDHYMIIAISDENISFNPQTKYLSLKLYRARDKFKAFNKAAT